MTEIGRMAPAVYVPPLPPAPGKSDGEPMDGDPNAAPSGPGGAADSMVVTPAASYEWAGARADAPRQCVIGLDGGGTKVTVAVADRQGIVLGGGTAGPCNIAAASVPDAFSAARGASVAALASAGRAPDDVVAVCAGVAGTSFTERRNQFTKALQEYFPKAVVAVEPDYAIALTGATGGGPGIVVIAGTGSVAYGEDARGRKFRSGAYGHLIDDDGSGYGVGRVAIAAVLREADHTGRPTALTAKLLESLALDDVAAIIPGIYGGTITRVKVAGLALLVAQVAQDGDAVAQAILVDTGSALAKLAVAVIATLFPDASDHFPVVMAGSLWKAGAPLTDTFRRVVHDAAPSAIFTLAKETPLHGAVRRALAMPKG